MGAGPTTDPRIAARWQLFGSGALFGLMAALARLGSRDASGFSGPQMATVRFAVGIAVVVAMFRMRPGTFRPVRHRLLVTRGVLGGLAVLLYFAALARMPAAEATLLNSTFPLLATVLSFWTLRERPPLHLVAALAAAAVGVLLVLRPAGGSFAMGAGTLCAIGAAIAAAISVTSIRALRATDNAPTIFFALSVGGLAVSGPLSLGAWPTGAAMWGVAIAAAVVSTAGQLLMTAAYGALTVAEAALWQQLTPVAAYLWALAIVGERLSLTGACGILLGAGGVAWGTALGGRAARRAAVQREDRLARPAAVPGDALPECDRSSP